MTIRIKTGGWGWEERRKDKKMVVGRVGLIKAQYAYVWNITMKPITYRMNMI